MARTNANTPTIEKVVVTPATATKWLATNKHNRNLRDRVVVTYAADMANGDWHWTGETIKFDAAGNLLDGQHRLEAVLVSKKTVPFLIVRGLDPAAQEDVDRGVPRQFHDVLKLRGEVNTMNLAALVKRVHNWEDGHRRSVGSAQGSPAQWLRTLSKHPELRDIARDTHRIYSACDLPGSIIGLAWWLFSRIDEEDANVFFERLADGTNLQSTHPIYVLRKTVALSKTDNGRAARTQSYLLALVIKAWNAYRDGDEVHQLRFRAGGAKPETFPEPK